MREQFIESISSSLSLNKNVLLLTADLGFGIFDSLKRFTGNQFFNVGVAEQLMASLACGLAVEGFEVFTYSIGVFPTIRALEQVRNDISYHNCSVTIVSSGAGFSYGALGMSHHCIQDLGYILSIPNITIQSPSNAAELSQMMNSFSTPRYLRLDKSTFSLSPVSSSDPLEPICYRQCDTEDKLLILFHGSIGEIAVPLINDYSFDLYSVPTLPSGQQLDKLISRYSHIITIEEHSIVNGFFSYVASRAALIRATCQITPLALPHIHHSIVGDQAYLRQNYGLTTQCLKSTIEYIL